MGIVEQYLLQLNTQRQRTRRTAVFLTVLSLLVMLSVSWNLRQTGIAIANDASCGYEEHQHTEECLVQSIVCADESESAQPHEHTEECYRTEYLCGYEEHIHSISCYSDLKADVETPLEWQQLFDGYPYTGNLSEDLVGVAKTQVGYTESALNFEVGDDGVRHGYTRYGAWYGASYNEWSAMFVSFCLSFAKADLNEYPISSGADTMAGLWNQQGRYASVGQYVPVSGDLVFFDDNTVGIVTMVQDATFYVICGDVDGAVIGTTLSLDDPSITGWGLTKGTQSVAEEPNELEGPTDSEETAETEVEEETEEEAEEPIEFEEADLLDITNGPAVFIFAESEEYTVPQQQKFALRNARTVTDMITYLQQQGGSFSYTLLDTNNTELPKDANGNYIVYSGTVYKLTFSVNSPNGFAPGTYRFRLPEGLNVNGGKGTFVLDGSTEVGEWEVSDDGLITMVFNDEMNKHTDVIISTTVGIKFPTGGEIIDFDGKITVTVESPSADEEQTELNKWGIQGGENVENAGTDPNKIYWTIEITGREDSQIPGSVITDQLMQGAHHYEQSDMDAGIQIGVGEYDPETGVQLAWHTWYVSSNDPNLEWTETGWSYRMPETVICEWCPNPITLGNKGWVYYVKYTSTPEQLGIAGKYSYTNSVTFDGQQATGWAEVTQGEAAVGVSKTGAFHGDANGGKFLWEFRVTVPGRNEGERAAYYTQIMDHLRVKNGGNGTVAYITNDADHATVTALYNGATINVPHVENATEADPFAWVVGWSSESGGIYYTRALLPLCRCNCTADSCHYWDGTNQRCTTHYYLTNEWGGYSSGFCYCWTYEQNMTLTFSYETNDPAVIDAYGGQGLNLQNEVILQNTVYLPDSSESTVTLGSAVANVPIPGVFKKELTKDYNGYTAHYQITVNEAKLTLTDGSPLEIHDVMTDTLAYISGSLVVTAEDANGNITTLQQGVDYTVTYDGTGNETNDLGDKVHVLDIVINHPQPVMYILNYDATLIIPEQVTGGVKYSNSASITLWGKEITGDSDTKVYADINIATKSYAVEVFKTCAQTKQPLSGATFGLYNGQGGLITTGVTDDSGKLLFRTNITEGIVLREHQLYYLQEMQAPMYYQQDNTKHWFCFCNDKGDVCSECNNLMKDVEAVRIPFDKVGIINITNYPYGPELPATGGVGTYIYTLLGLSLISAPFVYVFSMRRKQERRLQE